MSPGGVPPSPAQPGRIDPAEIQRLKQSYPIADVVAHYGVALRGRGRSLTGRCPFHDDHTPSLVVWPGEGRFKCFGCGARGDVIEFVRRAEQCDFRTAVTHLGGVFTDRLMGSLPAAPRRDSPTPSAPPLILDAGAVRILEVAVQAYHRHLLDCPDVLSLLAARGVNEVTARAYQIGYSDGRRLVPALQRRGLSLSLARRLGLLGDQGEWLSHRITFPVVQAGRTVFLMGRCTRPADEPKYLGLPLPKPLYVGGSQVAREALVVEGPFDLWLLHEWGYGTRYALVALLGTQPSLAHLVQLRGYARLFVCLDNDEAGQSGAAVLGELGQQVQRVPLPPDLHDVGDLGGQSEGRTRWATIAADAGIASPLR